MYQQIIYYWNYYFGKIESKEKAIRIINYISKVFIILGVIQIIFDFIFIYFFFESKIVIDIIDMANGPIYIIFGFLLRKFKKMIVVNIFLLYFLIKVVDNILGIQNRSIFIMGIIIVVIVSIQAIRAIRKYNE